MPLGSIMVVSTLLIVAPGVLSDLERMDGALFEEQHERIEEMQYCRLPSPNRHRCPAAARYAATVWSAACAQV